MNAPRDPDRMIHAFLMEGEEQLDDQLYDAVRAEIEQKRQRAFFGPWSAPAMNKITFGLGAAAVVLIGAVLGAQLLGSPDNTGSDDPSATPQATGTPASTATPDATASLRPSNGTVASGSFTAPLNEFGEAIEIEAVRTGDEVSGTIEISNPADGEGAYSVDVQCGRTTEDGFIFVGGEVTESTYREFIEAGAYVVIAFAPGTPVRMLWAVDVLAADEVPAPAESCSAFVETLLTDEMFNAVDVLGRPIEGDLALGQ